MATARHYAVVYVLLLALAISKVVFFELFGYWEAMSATFLAATAKIMLIAGYFQHLRHEPRSLTYLMATALFMVLLLAGAATFAVAG